MGCAPRRRLWLPVACALLLPWPVVASEGDGGDREDIVRTYQAAAHAHQSGDLVAALDLYQKVVQLNPRVASVHNNMGSIFHKLRQIELAEESYAKATTLPDCPVEAHLNRCILLSEELGDFAQARLQCLKAIERRPHYFQAYQQLGNIEQSQGRAIQAQEYFQRARLLSMSELEEVKASAAELFQWDPVEVGHQRQVELGGDELVTLETLSVFPAVFRVRRFLNATQTHGLIAEASSRLQDSQTIGQASRKSRTAWLSTHQSALLLQLARRVSRLAQVPEEVVLGSEELQVLHYEAGGHFGLHHESTSFLRRFATIVYYLNDVASGGELCFPSAQVADSSRDTCANEDTCSVHEQVDSHSRHRHSKTPECAKGLLLTPRAGDAILFYNYKGDGDVDTEVMHAACEVLEGEKWAANHWINLQL